MNDNNFPIFFILACGMLCWLQEAYKSDEYLTHKFTSGVSGPPRLQGSTGPLPAVIGQWQGVPWTSHQGQIETSKNKQPIMHIHTNGLFRLSNSALMYFFFFFAVGGSWRTWREHMQTQVEHANSIQKGSRPRIKQSTCFLWGSSCWPMHHWVTVIYLYYSSFT